MAGYCRQSDADIIPNEVIKAAPINKEFNCLRDAFCCSGGHTHDGSTTEGAFVPLIADSDKNNYVCVDTTNNRVSFFTEVSASPVEQIRVQDGAIVPVTDNDVDLGVTSTNRFKNLFLAGNATVAGTSTVTGNSTFGGTLGITGVTTFSDTICGTDFCSTGTSTLATVDINAGNIDNTVIGATTAAAGSFTTLSTTGQGTFATVDINGGTIDGATIGGTTAGAVTGTTVTANTCFVGNITGDVTGAVTGNVTGNAAGCHTGNFDGVVGATTPAAVTGTTITANTCFVGDITGAVTGNVTGNVTGDLIGNVISVGTSTFCDINMTGTAGIDLGSAKITSVADPTADGDAANKCYVDTQISNLIGGAPSALDTLNELAAAINDDAAFYTSVTTCLGTKLNTSGGTMSGAIAMGTNKITGLGDPTAAQDAATKTYTDTCVATALPLSGGTMTGDINMGGVTQLTNLPSPTLGGQAANKTYVDTQRDTRLATTGGTMTGTIDMGANKITTTYTPTNAADLTTKTYVDSILGSATCAEASCVCAAASATAAATSATNASNSATAAATSATNAETAYDNFDDRYLGDKSGEPSVDNDGDALLTGALYYDTTDNQLRVYTGSAWSNAAFTLGDALTCIQEDTSPTLGGNLNANSQCITNATSVCGTNFYGALTGDVTGNVTGCVSTLANFNSSDVCFGSVCVTSNPTLACQLATKEYVDTIAAAGIHYHDPVRVESPDTAGNLNATYDNGSSGVGATLTNAGTQAALVIDGVTLNTNDRVLIYSQTNGYENGVYTVTNTGSASTNWVLTRATDADSYGASDQDALGEGDAFFVKEGDTGAGELYVMNTSGTITFGTTNISFTVVAETAVYDAGTGMSLDGTTFSIGQSVGTTDNVTFACVCASNCFKAPAICATSSVHFPDNSCATFGASDDLKIFHNGSASIIKDAGVGDLYIAGSSAVKITNDAINEDLAVFNHNGSVDLYYDSSKKLETTTYGASTTGCHCATSCVKAPTVCGSSYVLGPRIQASICVLGPIIRGDTCAIAPIICGTTCMVSPDFNATSDCRCKDNITTVENAYCKIGQIRGVNYNWKDSGKYTMGVVAQEVEEAFPELVTTDDDGYKSVNYNGLVGALIETVKCLQGKVEELENGSKG